MQLAEYSCVEIVRISGIRAVILIAEYEALQEERLAGGLSYAKEKMEEKYDIPVSIGVGYVREG